MKLNIFAQYIVLSTLIVSILGCSRCDKSVTCPGLSQVYRDMIHVKVGDSIRFTTDQNEKMIFVIDYTNITEPEVHECVKHKNYPNCFCGNCDRTNGIYSMSGTVDSVWAVKDTFNDGWNSYFFSTFNVQEDLYKRTLDDGRIEEEYFADVLINIGGATSIVYNISPFELKLPSQQLLPSFDTPNNQYKQIIHQRMDTTARKGITPEKPYVSEVFVHPAFGIIAFRDRKSGNLFYRE